MTSGVTSGVKMAETVGAGGAGGAREGEGAGESVPLLTTPTVRRMGGHLRIIDYVEIRIETFNGAFSIRPTRLPLTIVTEPPAGALQAETGDEGGGDTAQPPAAATRATLQATRRLPRTRTTSAAAAAVVVAEGKGGGREAGRGKEDEGGIRTGVTVAAANGAAVGAAGVAGTAAVAVVVEEKGGHSPFAGAKGKNDGNGNITNTDW